MREGAAAGVTTPRVLAERALAQLEALTPEDMTKSALWKPIVQFPASMDAEARNRVEADYRRVLADEMFPALRRLAAFVRNDYLPKARTTDGFGALPSGDRMYRFAVRNETTTDLTPDEIHELGLREVKRIQASLSRRGAEGGLQRQDERGTCLAAQQAGELPVHLRRAGDRAPEPHPRAHRAAAAEALRPAAEGALRDPAHRSRDRRLGARAVLRADRRRPPRHLRDAGRRPAAGLDLRPRRAARARGHARAPPRDRHQAREQGARVPPPAVVQRLRRGLGAVRRIARP